ncbi:MAG: cystathionine gamma-synthase [Actinomycetota bacterium]|nr:cystathionine gamma-synthase [Actinomycetota bacterium]
MEGMHPETAAVFLGRPEQPGDPVNPPIVMTSTYRAEGVQTYGRDGNPTWEAFEEVIGALEGGTALAFASGMAAISAVVETVPAGAAVVADSSCYSGTRRLLHDLSTRGRVAPRLIDTTDRDAVRDAVTGAALLWIESPTNPLCRVVDIAGVVADAHAVGVPVAVDNTLATPMLQQPLSLGADVVVHSATKQISGHSDVLMGLTVTGDEQWLEQLRTRRSLHGAAPGPFEVFLALRGVRTMPLRVERSAATAAELASRLRAHPSVHEVLYPGMAAVVSFDLGSQEAADKVCGAVQVICPATSLGGVESLIERRARWSMEDHLPAGLIRLSVGLEHVDDLWQDLSQALSS